MKRFSLEAIIFLLLLISQHSFSQLKRGQKFLKKQQYELAITAFENEIFGNKEYIAVQAEHHLAKIYFNKNYEGFSLERAYEYAKSAKKRCTQLSNKELRKLQKQGLNTLTLDHHKRQIVNQAYAEAKAEDSYDGYQYFLQTYDGPTPIQFEKVTIWRNQKGLKKMQEIDRFSSYENFRKSYLEDLQKYTPGVDSVLQMEMFESFIQENSWGQYGRFKAKYPNNVYVKDSVAAAYYRPIATSPRISDFKDFIIGYPNSIFASLAVKQIYKLTMQYDRLGDYDYFVRSYPDFKGIEALWERYLELYLKQQGASAAEQFRQSYPNAPPSIVEKTK